MARMKDAEQDSGAQPGGWTRPPEVGRKRGPIGVPRAILVLVLLMVVIEAALVLTDIGVGPTGLRFRIYDAFAFHDRLFDAMLAGDGFTRQVPLSTLTYTMLHGGLIHVAFNGAALLGLGAYLSRRISARRVILAVFVTSIGGAVAFGLMASVTVPLVGASGGVFGLLGVLKRWEYEMLRRTPGLSWSSFWRSMIGLALLNVILSVFSGGAVAWEAHLGGFVAGWLIALWLARR